MIDLCLNNQYLQNYMIIKNLNSRRIVMNNLKILSVLFLFVLSFPGVSLADGSDNTVLKYYSAFLSVDLNHALGSSKIIYHLSQKQSFDKNFLDDELSRIQEDINRANNDIANIIINTIGDHKKAISKYLENIDKHLSQASLDLRQITDKINKQENFTPLISDIYYQINKAETEDHKEIARTLELKQFEEPLLVKPAE